MKPRESVIKPGIISKIAAKAIDAPEIISKRGILFLYRLYTPDLKVFKPSIFAKYIPMKAVKKIRKLC